MFRFIMHLKRNSLDTMRYEIFDCQKVEIWILDTIAREELSFQRLMNKLK